MAISFFNVSEGLWESSEVTPAQVDIKTLVGREVCPALEVHRETEAPPAPSVLVYIEEWPTLNLSKPSEPALG